MGKDIVCMFHNQKSSISLLEIVVYGLRVILDTKFRESESSGLEKSGRRPKKVRSRAQVDLRSVATFASMHHACRVATPSCGSRFMREKLSRVLFLLKLDGKSSSAIERC